MSKKRKQKKPARQTNKNYQILSYHITYEPLKDKYAKRIPKKIMDEIQDIPEQIEIKSHAKKIIPRLQGYVKKYPDVPVFYNFLSTAYGRIGDKKKYESTILESIKKHPDYLFAKLSYADFCLQKRKPQKVPEILDHKFDLKLMYPRRSKFHITEFAAFTSVMCRYYNAVGKREEAELLYKNLKKIAPEHPAADAAQRDLYPSLVHRIFKKLIN